MNFTALNDLIKSGLNEICLEEDVIIENEEGSVFKKGIRIDQNININGNGHCIDAGEKATIFSVGDANAVFQSLEFINAKGTYGGAIFNSKGNLEIIDCKFIGNVAEYGGAAIFNDEGNADIRGSDFKNNHTLSNDGCAIKNRSILNVTDSNFENNHIIKEYYGGAHMLREYFGGAIKNGGKLYVNNSNFINSSTKYGHSICLDYGEAIIKNSYFENNDFKGPFEDEKDMSGYKGLIYCSRRSNLVLEHCTFNDKDKTALYNMGNASIRNLNFEKDYRIINYNNLEFPGENFDLMEKIIGEAYMICDNLPENYNGFDYFASMINDSVNENDGFKEIALDSDCIFLNNSISKDSPEGEGSLGGVDSVVGDGSLVGECLDEEKYLKADFNLAYDKLIFDGKNHIINGNYGSLSFELSGREVIFKNMIFANFKSFELINKADSISFENCTFKNLKNDGGVIHNHGDSFRIINSNFENIFSNGAAVIVNHDGKIEISLSNFEKLTSERIGDFYKYAEGGAICQKGNRLNIDNSNFISCESEHGGAIFIEDGTALIRNAEFLKNYASYSYAGGAIHNQDASVRIENSSFTENMGDEFGGAIYNRGSIDLFNSSFIKNIVDMVLHPEINPNKGGAIFNDGGKIVIGSCEFIENIADWHGEAGAICNENGSCLVRDSIFISNTQGSINAGDYLVFSNCVFVGDYLYNKNGFLKVERTSFIDKEKLSNFDFYSQSNMQGLKNHLKEGKGNSVDAFELIFFSDKLSPNFDDRILYNRGACQLISISLEEHHYIENDTLIYILESEKDILGEKINNDIRIEGGGIFYLNDGHSDSMDKLIGLIENVSNDKGNDSGSNELSIDFDVVMNYGFDGPIEIDCDNLIIDGKGHSIDANFAPLFNITGNNIILRNFTFKNALFYEGAVINNHGNNLSIINCEFYNNRGVHGGAICNYGNDLMIKGSVFKMNSLYAGGKGGAIFNHEGASICITDSEFIKSIGGAIHNEGKLNIKNSRFTENNATSEGGAICNDGSLIVEKTSFKDNGARTGAAIKNNNELSVSECHFEGGHSYMGAGICNSGNVLTIKKSEFIGNRVSEYGAAIFSHRECNLLRILDSYFEDNLKEYYNYEEHNVQRLENNFIFTLAQQTLISDSEFETNFEGNIIIVPGDSLLLLKNSKIDERFIKASNYSIFEGIMENGLEYLNNLIEVSKTLKAGESRKFSISKEDKKTVQVSILDDNIELLDEEAIDLVSVDEDGNRIIDINSDFIIDGLFEINEDNLIFNWNENMLLSFDGPVKIKVMGSNIVFNNFKFFSMDFTNFGSLKFVNAIFKDSKEFTNLGHLEIIDSKFNNEFFIENEGKIILADKKRGIDEVFTDKDRINVSSVKESDPVRSLGALFN